MKNPFANILDFKKLGLFQNQSKSVVGIDIGASSIKVVQVRRDAARAVLETYGEIALGPYATAEIGQAVQAPTAKLVEALADVFRESSVNTKRAALSIPLRSSFITLIDIPATDENVVNQMVPIEARKYVPVPISEVALDWWIVPQPETEGAIDSGQTKAPPAKSVEVLLVAIHNSILTQYREIVEKSELVAGGFEIEMFSAVRAILGHEPLPVMVLDCGAGTTKVSIVDFGVVKVSQTISRGAQDLTLALSKSMSIPFAKAEEIKRRVGLLGTEEGDVVSIVNPILEYIFSEANQVLKNYQKKHQRSVAKVILIGSGSLLQGFADIAKKSFAVEVEYGNPFKKVEAPAFLEGVLSDAGPSFAVAIGSALRAIQESA